MSKPIDDLLKKLEEGLEIVPGHVLVAYLDEGTFGQVWSATGPGNVLKALKIIPLDQDKGLKEFCGIRRVRDVRGTFLVPITGIWLLDENLRHLSDDVIKSLEGQVQGSSQELARTLPPDFGIPSLLVVAMELCDKTLKQLLKEYKDQGKDGIPIKELLRYMEHAALGIDDLNSPRHKPVFQVEDGSQQGHNGQRVALIHGDIKPENIMLVGNGAKICDFSLAEVLGTTEFLRKTMAKQQAAGTVFYMAPEVWLGKKSLKSDQYSLAITYCELRAGEPPYSTEARSSFHHMQEAKEHEDLCLSKLPETEQEVIRRATHFSPKRRYESCIDMVHALQQAVKGEEQKPPVPWPRYVAGLIMMCCIVVVAIWYMMRNKESDIAKRHFENGEIRSGVELTKNIPFRKLGDVLPSAIECLKSYGTSKEETQVKEALVGCASLISYLRNEDLASKEYSKELDDIERVANDIFERLLSKLRKAIAKYNPPKSNNFPETEKQLLKFLREDENLSVIRNHKSFGPSLDLLDIRVALRENKAPWFNEKNRVSKLNDLPDEDLIYHDVLDFILNSASKPDNSKDLIDNLTNLGDIKDQSRFSGLDDWEKNCLLNEERLIYSLIQPDWLKDRELRRLIKKVFPKDDLTRKIVNGFVEFCVDKIKEDRAANNYAKAREWLLCAHEEMKSSGGQLNKGLEDEAFILDLVDPDTWRTTVQERLAPENPMYADWLIIADRILDEQKKLDKDQRAFICALKLESELMIDPNLKELPSDMSKQMELIEKLENSQYADYGSYVSALFLARTGSPRAAAENIVSSFQHEGSKLNPLLSRTYRKNQAATILRQAAQEWKPTDKTIGTHKKPSTIAEDAYRYLSRARKLSTHSLTDDSLWLASTLFINSDTQEKQIVDEILQVSEQILKQQDKPEISSLYGTIGFIRAKALQSQIGKRNEVTDIHAQIVQHYAIALRHLHLENRVDISRDNVIFITNDVLDLYNSLDPKGNSTGILSSEGMLHDQKIITSFSEQVSIIYRSAGFLCRHEYVARRLREDLKINPDDIAYQYLHQANCISSDADALIEEGYAIEFQSARPTDWLDSVESLASNALEMVDGENNAKGRAYELKGYALLLKSRSTNQPIECLKDAIDLYSDAESFWRNKGNDPVAKACLANCLAGRGTACVEYSFYSNSDVTKKEYLRRACKDAEEASQIDNRPNPSFAWNTWGNALEDMALYLNLDPHNKYSDSLAKFGEALKNLEDWEMAHKLATRTNISRCTVRFAESGYLPRNEAESKLGLLLNDKDYGYLARNGIGGMRSEKPYAEQFVELAYWISRAYYLLALYEKEKHIDDNNIVNLLKQATTCAENSLDVAREINDPRLSEIQVDTLIKYVSLKIDSDSIEQRKKKFQSVKILVDELIENYKNEKWKVSCRNLYDAIMYKINCGLNVGGGIDWDKEFNWNEIFSLFSKDDPMAQLLKIRLMIQHYKMSQVLGNREIQEIESLINALSNGERLDINKREFNATWQEFMVLKARQAEKEANQAEQFAAKADINEKTINEWLNKERDCRINHAVHLTKAVEYSNNTLPEDLRNKLMKLLLKEGRERESYWNTLEEMEKEEIAKHLEISLIPLIMSLRKLLEFHELHIDKRDLDVIDNYEMIANIHPAEQGRKLTVLLRPEYMDDKMKKSRNVCEDFFNKRIPQK